MQDLRWTKRPFCTQGGFCQTKKLFRHLLKRWNELRERSAGSLMRNVYLSTELWESNAAEMTFRFQVQEEWGIKATKRDPVHRELVRPGRNSCSPLKPNDSADRPTALVQTNTTQHLWKGLPWNLEKTFRYYIKTAFRKLEHQIIPTKWLVSLSDFWTIRSIMSMLVGLRLCKCSRNASLLVDMS